MTKVCGKDVKLPAKNDNIGIIKYVMKFLLEQNEKSTNFDDGSCCYRIQRSDKVLACGVGCLIPDWKYRKIIEGASINPDQVPHKRYDELKEIVKGMDQSLLFRIQRIHDQNPPCEWKSRFENLLDEYSELSKLSKN